jgi:hypothetical protein
MHINRLEYTRISKNNPSVKTPARDSIANRSLADEYKYLRGNSDKKIRLVKTCYTSEDLMYVLNANGIHYKPRRFRAYTKFYRVTSNNKLNYGLEIDSPVSILARELSRQNRDFIKVMFFGRHMGIN